MSAPASTPIPRARRRPLLVLLLVLCLLGGAGGGAYYWLVARFFEHTDDAYVAASVIDVTPQVTGTVVAVAVRDTDRVDSGQSLVELERADAEISLQQAEAELARSLRQVRTVYAGNQTLSADIAVRRAELKRAQADADKAQGDLDTRAALVVSGAVGKEELKHAQAALATAEAARNTARATIMAAQERLSAKRAVQVGQRVAPGSSLLSIVPLEHVWVEADAERSRTHIFDDMTKAADLRIAQIIAHNSGKHGDGVAAQP